MASSELLRQVSRLLEPVEGGSVALPDARNVADLLWLTRMLPLERPGRIRLPDLGALDLPEPGEQDAEADRAWDASLREALSHHVGGAPAEDRDHGSEPSESEASAGSPEQPSRADAAPSVAMHLPHHPEPRPAQPFRSAAAVRAPARPALESTLALSRSVRPLRRTVDSRRRRELDEAATVELSGQVGVVLPVWRPVKERWLAADLVVDSASSMTIWNSAAAELTTALGRAGAFTHVRTWRLLPAAGPSGQVLVPFRGGAAGARGSTPVSALADPRVPRVVLLLTDGVSPVSGRVALDETLRLWAQAGPVAVLQVLPRRLWPRTVMNPVPVRARAVMGERPVTLIRTDGGSPLRDARGSAAWIPVLEAQPDWLRPWARMLAGRRAGWTRMVALPLGGSPEGTGTESPAQDVPPPATSEEDPASAVTPGSAASVPEAPPGSTEPTVLLTGFRRTASPMAFRLAGLLAASPLSLPVMRHVQHAMLPQSGPTHLAEVFLSGLLERRSAERDAEDPEDVVYDFRTGVREHLLNTLTTEESRHVLGVLAGVSRSVAGSLGVLDFRSLVPLAPDDPDRSFRLPSHSLPFAEVAVSVLAGLGGEHRALARRIAQALPAESAMASAGLTEEPLTATPTRRSGPRAVRPWNWLSRSVTTADPDTPTRQGAADGPDGTTPAARAEQVRTPDPQNLMGSARLDLNNLPEQRPDLTGREAKLLEIQRVLHGLGGLPDRRATPRDRSVCVIQGAPEVGKTDLALGYARLHRHDYSLVWWIDGSSHRSAAAGLAQLAAALGFQPGPSFDPLNGDLRVWLQTHPGWLVVFDDLGSAMPESERWRAGFAPAGLLDAAWPPDRYGSILITTRQPAPEARPGAVPVVHLGPARPVVPQRATPEQDTSELAALPALLERTSELSDPAARTGAGSPAPAPVQPVGGTPESAEETAWITSRLDRVGGEGLALLGLCAFLAPTGVAATLLTRGARALSLSVPAADRSDGDDGVVPGQTPGVLEQLIGWRLLQTGRDGRTGGIRFIMTNPVRQAVRQRLGPGGRARLGAEATALIASAFPTRPLEAGTWDQCLSLLPHAHTVVQLPSFGPAMSSRQADLLFRLGEFRAARGEFAESQVYLRQEIRLRTALGEVSATARSRVLLAEVLLARGDKGAAMQQAERALGLLDGEVARTSRGLCNRALRVAADVCIQQLDYDGALARLSEARSSLEDTVGSDTDLPEDHLTDLWIRCETGVIHALAGRLATAERWLDNTWMSVQRLGSRADDEVRLLAAMVSQGRARIGLLRGDASRAQAQAIHQSLPWLTRQNHLRLDQIMTASATIVEILLESLHLLERNWQHAAPEYNYEAIRRRDLDTALGIAEVVLSFRRARKSWQPRPYACFLDVYAELRSMDAGAEAVVPVFEEATQLHRDVHGADHPAHPDWARHLRRRARVLLAASEPEQAATLLVEAESVLRATLGDHHPELFVLYTLLARTAESLVDPRQLAPARHWRELASVIRAQPEFRQDPRSRLR